MVGCPSLRILKVHHCLSHGYHWLPLATIDLVGDNRELEVIGNLVVWGIF